MRELAVVVDNKNENNNPFETIDAIKSAGFKNVFIQWYNRDWDVSQEEQLKYIKKQGLNIIFAHLGYKNINDIWLEGDEYNYFIDYYKNDIKTCKENGIPLVIMHLTSKNEAPMYNEVGLRRLQEIVDYAESLGIKVAFENTKIKGYVDYVIDHIKNENVGICFDAGHYHVHFNDEFDFPKFKNKIFAVHLHDNDQSDDLHLLPFDGTLNWEKTIEKIKECNYEGPITMELCYRRGYLKMNIEDFYKRGYEIGEKLRNMFDN